MQLTKHSDRERLIHEATRYLGEKACYVRFPLFKNDEEFSGSFRRPLFVVFDQQEQAEASKAFALMEGFIVFNQPFRFAHGGTSLFGSNELAAWTEEKLGESSQLLSESGVDQRLQHFMLGTQLTHAPHLRCYEIDIEVETFDEAIAPLCRGKLLPSEEWMHQYRLGIATLRDEALNWFGRDTMPASEHDAFAESHPELQDRWADLFLGGSLVDVTGRLIPTEELNAMSEHEREGLVEGATIMEAWEVANFLHFSDQLQEAALREIGISRDDLFSIIRK